jgi:RNA-directed DNA polymerase
MHAETSFVRNLGDLIRARRRTGLVHEGNSSTMGMYAGENPDEGIRAEKPPNKGGLPPAEQRTSPKGNGGRTAAARTLSRGTAPDGLAAVRQAVRRSKQTKFTALLHHIAIGLLKQSFQALERNAAPGTDGVTWYAYREENLEEKLKDLRGRIHRGSYRARPAKRTN